MTAVFKHCSKKLLLCYALICPFATVTSTAFAMSLQPIIDVGLTGDGRAFVTTTAAAVIIACLSELSFYIENIIKNGVVISYTKNLRIHYFRTFFQQDIARFLEKDSAEYLSKLTVDAEVIGQKYCESMLRLYKSLWSLAISSVCIASARWELAIYVLVISCISVNLPRLFQGKANASEQDYLESSSAHIKLAQESIRNYLVIRLFKLRPSQLEQYEQAVSAVERRDNTRKKRAFAVDAAAGAISSIGFILVIALCMVFVLQGKLSVGYTMSVSQLLGGIQFPFEILPGYLVAYRSGRDLYWTNEAELQKDVKAEGGKTLRLTPTDNRMEINQMSFSYNTDHPAIFKKKYAVVGESGSGKSTLAKIVMGLLEPSCGDVWLNGVPLCEIDKSSLYDVITYQDQSASFFNGTIKENIVLGEQLPENTWRQIITASCLDGLLDKLPEGEFTVIEENGKNISGGEAQRICLARCLARRPSFIIFDEIAAALDTQNAAAIEKSILSLENTGILQITHRIAEENMRQYDSIFVLKGGRIAEQGTWDDLVAQKGEFYRLLIHSSEPAV